jgi:hypothetical protein
MGHCTPYCGCAQIRWPFRYVNLNDPGEQDISFRQSHLTMLLAYLKKGTVWCAPRRTHEPRSGSSGAPGGSTLSALLHALGARCWLELMTGQVPEYRRSRHCHTRP